MPYQLFLSLKNNASAEAMLEPIKWIYIIDLTYEFLIRSEKQEKEILELVEKWRENGLNVEVGKSSKMFWEIFM